MKISLYSNYVVDRLWLLPVKPNYMFLKPILHYLLSHLSISDQIQGISIKTVSQIRNCHPFHMELFIASFQCDIFNNFNCHFLFTVHLSRAQTMHLSKECLVLVRSVETLTLYFLKIRDLNAKNKEVLENRCVKLKENKKAKPCC